MSAVANTPPHLLDAKGLKCPLPVLKLRKRLHSLPQGAHIEIITDDPAAVIDIPHFCAEQGHVLLTQKTSGGEHHFLVQKHTEKSV